MGSFTIFESQVYGMMKQRPDSRGDREMTVDFAWLSPGTQNRCEKDFNLPAIRMYIQNRLNDFRNVRKGDSLDFYIRKLDVTVCGYLKNGTFLVENLLPHDQTIYD
jgi:hypothetical protein